MKSIILIFCLFILSITCALGQIHLTPNDEITLSGRSLDSLGFYVTPDSVRVVVYHDGVEAFDNWFNTSDAQCYLINDMLVFTDSMANLDNDAGDGLYQVMAGFFLDAGDLYHWKSLWVYLGVDMGSLATIEARVDSLLDTLLSGEIPVVALDTNINGDTLAVVGTNQVMRLQQLRIVAADDSDAVYISAADGNCIYMSPAGNTHAGINIEAQGNAAGIRSIGNGIQYGMILGGPKGLFVYSSDPAGTQPGLHISGGNYSTGLKIDGGLSYGRGVDIVAGGDSAAVNIEGRYFVSEYIEADSIVGKITDEVTLEPDALGSAQLAESAASEIALVTADSVLVDSLSYQGSGGGSANDSASIARWVWNTPQGNHNLAGTFGGYLDAEISGLGFGSGIYSVEVTAFDSISDQPVPGVSILVRNLEQNALIALGKTDPAGRVGFNLDADSFSVIASATGYLFPAFDTLIVNGSMTDTIFGEQFNPGQPASPDLCRVYGFVYDISGQPVEDAVITASLPLGVRMSGGTVISPFYRSAESDSTGYFYLDLIFSADLVPLNSAYDFTLRHSDGTIIRQTLIVPDSDFWQLTW